MDTQVPSEMNTQDSLPFLKAAQEMNYDCLDALVAEGKDVNRRDERGYTALHRAVTQRPSDLNTVAILLTYGADTLDVFEEENTSRPKTPLHHAAIKGDVRLVSLLLRHARHDPTPRSLKYWTTPLEDAISNGHLAVIEKFIQFFSGDSLLYKPTRGIDESIILAAKLWYSKALSLILDYRKQHMPRNTNGGPDVLKQAFCEAIRSEACDPSVQGISDRTGGPGDNTPSKCANLLIQAGIKFNDDEIDRILSITCSNAHLIGVTRLLLNLGPKVTAHHIYRAIESQSYHMVKIVTSYVINSGGEGAMKRDCEPDLVQYAASHGSLDTFEYLSMQLETTSSLSQPITTTESRKTPLIHYAVWGLRQAVVKHLLSMQGSNVNERDEHGHTPLMYAFDIVDASEETMRLPVIQLLVEHGVNLHASSIEGLTPLHLAVRLGLTPVVQLLLTNRCDPNAKTTTGSDLFLRRNPSFWSPAVHARFRTPLHWAVDRLANVSVDVVMLLLHHGADINAEDGNGVTPLNLLLGEGWCMNGAWESRMAVAHLLLSSGADPDIRDMNGITARQRASQREIEICASNVQMA
ncbi:hypothetical protein ASPBRDRAFT_193957 [Aspergillus brasiliensis CBS 101740]|uniref:Uncharacterized protein n=1 Tax=Aspergillus brasiliensis (strain CBS 101740 / IMI 381727 / IBT 21946) TaxID=767769 RepID=A0A1L9UUR0_ASPBC|nr:hypothetical protein ASPBRDRAFT_193957 [Aspergillus brasiliensis CBS 101740]